MNPRHAAAFALIGYYLMLPPTQEMLDPSCQWGHSSLAGFFGALMRGGSDYNIVICDRESLFLDTSAPLSEWQSGEAFEALAECQAERAKPVTEDNKRGAEAAARIAAYR